jgi:guanylate kinase
MVIVLSGPGGVGKGTIAAKLVEADAALRLSRSWTTRDRRPGERADAYVFVPRAEFVRRAEAGGFLETNEFHGNLYGTPLPSTGPEDDLLLEIDVHGARQVRERDPEALLLFVDAPNREVQRQRLVGRGDSPDRVQARLDDSERERSEARSLGCQFFVNDDLERVVAEIRERIAEARRADTSANSS